MPRLVDNDVRRAELVAAVWRVVLRGGVSAASVRKVAAEAGLSAGSVRYFFSDQQELLHAAMREVVRRAQERVLASGAERGRLVAQGRAGEAVVQLLAETLPLDEQRLAEARVWFAFVSHDASDVTVRAIRQELDGELLLLVRRSVADLAALGALGAGREQASEATMLTALLDGLAIRLLLEPDTLKPDAALKALSRHIAQLRLPVGH